MEQKKLVSFEVAKAIEYIGYPQELTEQVYTELGELVSSAYGEWHKCYDAPTYIDVWLWLWREKKIRILLEDAKDPKEPEIERGCYVGTNQLGGMCSSQEFADPEDAIVDIIGYLVENNLIK